MIRKQNRQCWKNKTDRNSDSDIKKTDNAVLFMEEAKPPSFLTYSLFKCPLLPDLSAMHIP